jgi:hypothetical protein
MTERSIPPPPEIATESSAVLAMQINVPPEHAELVSHYLAFFVGSVKELTAGEVIIECSDSPDTIDTDALTQKHIEVIGQHVLTQISLSDSSYQQRLSRATFLRSWKAWESLRVAV